MVSKIIYICCLPLTEKLEQDFYIKDAIDLKYTVEYWDLSSLFFGSVNIPHEYNRDYVREIRTYQQFRNQIKNVNNSGAIYIPMVTYGYRSFRLYRILTKNGCKLFYFERGCLPSAISRTLWEHFVGKLRSVLNGKKLVEYIGNKFASFMKKLKVVKNYDAVFTAGQIAESIHRNTSKVVPVHYFDYDEYIRIQNDGGRIVSGNYSVFLDDNIVENIDYDLLGIKTVIAENYYSKMKFFFDAVEKRYNIKVVVAMHPKANYGNNPFGHREIYKYETSRLVDKCDFAMMHYSSSISYPILFKKPIIFIYTPEMKKMFYFRIIRSFAEKLHRPLVDIDSLDTENFSLKETEDDRYEEYKLKYITSLRSDSGCSRDIFLKFIESYDNPS